MSRSPHGERGLKFRAYGGAQRGAGASLPARGAWIEMSHINEEGDTIWSLPARGAWIEILKRTGFIRSFLSRSPHGERGLK